MRRAMLRRLAAIPVLMLAVAVGGLTACGHDGDDGPSADTPPTTRSQPPAPEQAPQPDSDLALPARVPDKPTQRADRASARVVRAWLRALNRGDVKRAARYFAIPSKFQNGTPVLTIDERNEQVAVNLALPCGGRPLELGAARGFTIVTLRLIQRRGADCGQGTGAIARSAIRVSGGRIREWYRLPDVPGGEQPAPPAASGSAV